MKAVSLYKHLERDFITPSMSDDWAQYMGSITGYLSDNYKIRSMGLVCDFTSEIGKVFTAVFPSDAVMRKILDEGARDALLFIHHPATWDIRKSPEVFRQMDRDLLRQFRDARISIFNLHVPLDNYGPHSTSVTLAKALRISPVKPFAPYFGALAGIIGETGARTVHELKIMFERAVGHTVRLYNYGEDAIRNHSVAVIAGGGLIESIMEVDRNNCNVFVTGISVKNVQSAAAHEYAGKHRINILGGTHYSTEQFACRSMAGYFQNIGLQSQFIGDQPVMEDM